MLHLHTFVDENACMRVARLHVTERRVKSLNCRRENVWSAFSSDLRLLDLVQTPHPLTCHIMYRILCISSHALACEVGGRISRAFVELCLSVFEFKFECYPIHIDTKIITYVFYSSI